jgi:ZIP family zinc transporter
VSGFDIFLSGMTASMATGLVTGVGALPALFFKTVSRRALNVMLGFAAGVMLAATCFSLILPALDYGGAMWGQIGGMIAVVVGIAIGAVTLDIVDRTVPHFHTVIGREGPSSALRKVWLFILAITIHNFPEGLAVGVGFGGGDAAAGITLAIGIGLQNMPEGLAVAVALMREGYGRWAALWIALATGLVEPPGGAIGAGIVTIARPFLPFGLAFAAGAMLFVIADEIIPETHSQGNERLATFGLIIGFLVMMAMDVLFG